MSIGVLLALALRERWLRARGLFRVLLILPWAVPNYITALIYSEGLNRNQQVALGVFVLVLNAAVYGWLLWRRRKSQTR